MRRYFKVDPAKAAAAVSGLDAKDAKVDGLGSTDGSGDLCLAEPRTKKALDEILKEGTAVELTADEARAQRNEWDNAIDLPIATGAPAPPLSTLLPD